MIVILREAQHTLGTHICLAPPLPLPLLWLMSSIDHAARQTRLMEGNWNTENHCSFHPTSPGSSVVTGPVLRKTGEGAPATLLRVTPSPMSTPTRSSAPVRALCNLPKQSSTLGTGFFTTPFFACPWFPYPLLEDGDHIAFVQCYVCYCLPPGLWAWLRFSRCLLNERMNE